jgi:predicted DNA-binding protein with PD1-like motif
MKFALLSDDGRKTKTFTLVFDKDDEFMRTLLDFAKNQGLTGSHFTAIGAFKSLAFGFFERERMDYRRIEIAEQVEVMSLIGTITTTDSGPKIHAHVVIGKSDGTAHGGHLLEAYVWPTLEVVLTEFPTELRRTIDDETRLALISLK